MALLPGHPCPTALARKSYRSLISFSLLRRAYRAIRGKSKSSPNVLCDPDSNDDSSGALESTRPSAVTRANTNPPSPPFAVELIERIADFLFELKPPVLSSTGDTPLCCTKPPWRDVSGWMYASLELHRMGYTRWLRVITIKKAEDWIIISQNLNLIRYCSIYCPRIVMTHSSNFFWLPINCS